MHLSHVTRESAQTDWVGVAHVEDVTLRSQRADHLSRIGAGSFGQQNPDLWLSRRDRSISLLTTNVCTNDWHVILRRFKTQARDIHQGCQRHVTKVRQNAGRNRRNRVLGQEHAGGRRGLARFGVQSLSRPSTLPGQPSLWGQRDLGRETGQSCDPVMDADRDFRSYSSTRGDRACRGLWVASWGVFDNETKRYGRAGHRSL